MSGCLARTETVTDELVVVEVEAAGQFDLGSGRQQHLCLAAAFCSEEVLPEGKKRTTSAGTS